MFEYEEPVIRPPAEADALILQATIGCTHNKCTFCITYKQKQFRVRSFELLKREIDWAASRIPGLRKVFLGDGDALAIPTDDLLRILDYIRNTLPTVRKIAVYASPGNFAVKTATDLIRLKKAGLTLAYVGLESGDDDTLHRIRKGFTAAEMAELMKVPVEAGIKLSVTVILGLAGPDHMERVAKNTARLIDSVQPRFASALTLMLPLGEDAYRRNWPPDWRMLKPRETLMELRHLVNAIESDKIIFRSNHASNYLPIEGTFQKGKPRMLAQIDAALQSLRPLRPEFLRGL
ncbi:MAG: radical SAM protein [Deltaproteobacteria bacterium]|nr:radical SAM protein [Deltaproteobacteria bacterium]